MEFRVEDYEQVDQSRSFGVKERRPKSGKPSHASTWKVEFRSTLFKKAEKIWVGTFKTREEANKACDAALHILGRRTYYYTYPQRHFREIGALPQDEDALKKRVKSWAKEYAKRPLPAPQLDHLALQCMLEAEDLSLEASNEYKQIYSEFQACCETSAREVGVGSADAAINSANMEAADDIIASIDSPLASVPRLEPHTRRHRQEFASIEGTDNVDQLEHADMCKSTED